jgi:hypothetical protein
LCDSATCRQAADAVLSKAHSRSNRRSDSLLTSSPVASPRKSTSAASVSAVARVSSSAEYPIRVSPSRTNGESPRIEIDDAPPRASASPGLPQRNGSPELERLLRENKSHLRQVNAELVATRDPARQRALLDERSLLNNTITALTEQVQQLSGASPPPLQHSVSVDGHNARLVDSPSRNAPPAGTVCSSCGSAKVGGRVKSDDGSSIWFCRNCLSQLVRCSRCNRVGKHTHSVQVGGVDCFLCDSCTGSASAAPAAPSSPSPQTTSSKSHRHTISYTSSASPQGSPSTKVPPIRTLDYSAPVDAPRAPATARSAPRRLTTSEPIPDAAPLPRAKSANSVSSTKLADGESIWGKGAAPWESFKAPREGRRLSDRLVTMMPVDKPKKGSSLTHVHSDRCTRCRVERGVNRVAREDGTVIALLCTSCRISLNFRAAIGE